MVWYAMLCPGMVWKVCYEISMLCYEISMLCYAMVYVVKDKHSATVSHQLNVNFDNFTISVGDDSIEFNLDDQK